MKITGILLIAAMLSGCETVENEDGSRTTRFDAAAATSVINTGFSTYDRYQKQQAIVGYDQFGNPIFRAQ